MAGIKTVISQNQEIMDLHSISAFSHEGLNDLISVSMAASIPSTLESEHTLRTVAR